MARRNVMERRLARVAPGNTGTAVMGELLPGRGITERVDTQDVPEDEIHIHFAYDRASRSDDLDGEDHNASVRAIGAANSDLRAFGTPGGFAGIDQRARNGREARYRAHGVRRGVMEAGRRMPPGLEVRRVYRYCRKWGVLLRFGLCLAICGSWLLALRALRHHDEMLHTRHPRRPPPSESR